MNDGKLKIVIDSDKKKHDRTALKSQQRDELAHKFEDMKVAEAEAEKTAA